MRGRGTTRFFDVLPTWSAFLLIVLGACAEDGVTPPVDPETSEPDTVVRSIQVNPPERMIGVLGTTVRFSGAALAEDGTVLYRSSRDPDRFSWSSSAPEIATVDVTPGSLGGLFVLVTGVSEGTATITATSEGVSGEMTVTVRDHARPAWSLPVGAGSITAGIAVGADGTIYVVSYQYGTTSQLFALSPQGSVLWTLAIPFRVISIPAIGDDGTLYLGSWASGQGGRLFAVDPGGTVRWVVEDLEAIRSSPAIGPDGTIYFGSHDGRFYAVSADGTEQWSLELDERGVTSSASIGPDGTIYVGVGQRGVHAIDPGGSVLWNSPPGTDTTPILGADGTVYVAGTGPSGERVIGALDSQGRLQWDYHTSPNNPTNPPSGLPGGSPAIGADGTIFSTYFSGPSVETSEGTLHATVETGSAGSDFEASPWPTERGDRANTGRARGLP